MIARFTTHHSPRWVFTRNTHPSDDSPRYDNPSFCLLFFRGSCRIVCVFNLLPRLDGNYLWACSLRHVRVGLVRMGRSGRVMNGSGWSKYKTVRVEADIFFLRNEKKQKPLQSYWRDLPEAALVVYDS